MWRGAGPGRWAATVSAQTLHRCSAGSPASLRMRKRDRRLPDERLADRRSSRRIAAAKIFASPRSKCPRPQSAEKIHLRRDQRSLSLGKPPDSESEISVNGRIALPSSPATASLSPPRGSTAYNLSTHGRLFPSGQMLARLRSAHFVRAGLARSCPAFTAVCFTILDAEESAVPPLPTVGCAMSRGSRSPGPLLSLTLLFDRAALDERICGICGLITTFKARHAYLAAARRAAPR
jgi:hypothetical protein